MFSQLGDRFIHAWEKFTTVLKLWLGIEMLKSGYSLFCTSVLLVRKAGSQI